MKVLISVLFFALVSSSYAEDMRYYDVEVIIFENLNPLTRKSENWPLQVHMTQPEKIVPLGEPVPKLKEWLSKDVDLKLSYKLLNSKEYRLSEHIEKLTEAKSKRVLFHTAWRQPGLDKKTAIPVYFKREIPVPPVTEEEASSLAQQPATTYPTELEGILRVTLARYLHLEAEMSLRDKLPELNSENPFEVLDSDTPTTDMEKQGIIYLKQKRNRIRSKELHYLDHPVLGILLLITPYELPEDVAATKSK